MAPGDTDRGFAAASRTASEVRHSERVVEEVHPQIGNDPLRHIEPSLMVEHDEVHRRPASSVEETPERPETGDRAHGRRGAEDLFFALEQRLPDLLDMGIVFQGLEEGPDPGPDLIGDCRGHLEAQPERIAVAVAFHPVAHKVEVGVSLLEPLDQRPDVPSDEHVLEVPAFLVVVYRNYECEYALFRHGMSLPVSDCLQAAAPTAFRDAGLIR